MTYKSWTPLWSVIVDSSIWDEPDHVFRTFIAMIALKDSDHVVRLTPYQLSKRMRRPESEVLDALKILCSPDKRREEDQEFEGRRIEMCEEGWLVLNGPKYREMVQLEMQRARNRRSQAAFRERRKGTSNGKQGGGAVTIEEETAEDRHDHQERVRIEAPKDPATGRSIREGVRRESKSP